MPHKALARVVVRMHHDPSFVERVFAEPDAVLGPLGVPAELREALLRTDRRAFAVDPLRRTRLLRTLTAEFPASTTLALAGTRRLASLEAFFEGEGFHGTVQHRGSLAEAFARHLAGLGVGPPQLPDVIRLELELARSRRELARPAPAPPPGTVARAPGVRAGTFDGSVLEVVNACERWLFEIGLLPAAALCDDRPDLPPLPPPRPDAPRHLLVQPGAAGPVLAEPGRVACEAVASLERPLPPAAFVDGAASRGLPKDAARRLLGDLEAAGLVVSS